MMKRRAIDKAKDAIIEFVIFFMIVFVWNAWQDAITAETVHEALNLALILSMVSELIGINE